MLARLTDNQLTLPDSVVEAPGRPAHVEIEVRDDVLIVSPIAPVNDDIRRTMEELGVTEDIVAEAVAWVREHR